MHPEHAFRVLLLIVNDFQRMAILHVFHHVSCPETVEMAETVEAVELNYSDLRWTGDLRSSL